jgi:hypothetical protein
MKCNRITKTILTLLFGSCASFGVAAGAHAEFIGNVQGGTDFPQGAISFADAVIGYAPGMVGTGPTEPHRGAFNALGLPNYAWDNSCASQAECTFVSLGDGGSITLRFTDNLLTGSGNNQKDLWIFEVGPDIEDTFVEISKNGVDWTPVGKVFGSTAGIDIDAYGFGTADQFAYVRLTDDTLLDGQSGATVGADIDAVGAISTVPAVPEPETWAMLLAGLGLFGFAARRRKRKQFA